MARPASKSRNGRNKAAKRKTARKTAAPRKTAKRKAARKTAKKKVARRKVAPHKPVRRKPVSAEVMALTRIGSDSMLRLEIEELHAAYAYCLDHGRIDEWPDFFTDDCLYKLISRENWDLGLPLGTMFAEKRGGLLDRVASVKQTTVYHERYLTHMIANTRVLSEKGGVVEASANYAVFETLPNQYTQILSAGRYLDRIVRERGRLKFREKLCIFDTVLVPASIIYPI